MQKGTPPVKKKAVEKANVVQKKKAKETTPKSKPSKANPEESKTSNPDRALKSGKKTTETVEEPVRDLETEEKSTDTTPKSTEKKLGNVKSRQPPRTFSVVKDDLFNPDSQGSKSASKPSDSESKGSKSKEKKPQHTYDRFLLFDFSGTVGRKGYNPIKEVIN